MARSPAHSAPRPWQRRSREGTIAAFGVDDVGPRRPYSFAMVTAARFRQLALSFEGATQVPHMERTAFRTKRCIFATMPPDGSTANLKLDLDLQEAVCEALPRAFAPVPGGWGRMGMTTVDLRVVDEADLARALAEAHARASAPAKPRARRARR